MAESPQAPPAFSSQELNTVELPPCIEIKESLVHKGEAGAFAKSLICKDTRFGPYKGEIIYPSQKDHIDYRYAWEVLEKRSKALKYTISAMDPKASNWMRHVNSARFFEEQNILSVQDGFSIFYVVMKDISKGDELLTWFDPKLLRRTQRRLTRTERRPIGYTIELVPWSDEKKFTPEIIETKRSRKKKVLSDMISLDEDPMAMTRTLQQLPKIPCTPRQLGNMAYPLANTLKRQRKLNPTSSKTRRRDPNPKKRTDRKGSLETPPCQLPKAGDSEGLGSYPHEGSEANLKNLQAKLELLPPHEELKEALQAAQDGPKMIREKPKMATHAAETKAQERQLPISNVSSYTDGQVKRSKKRGRKRLSDMPIGISGSLKDRKSMGNAYSQAVKPTGIKNTNERSIIVDDHDECYRWAGALLRAECDDRCPCLDKRKAMLGAALQPSAGNSYAMRFTLLPEHRIIRNNRILYKCDVCDGTYNHALSLKRHYLSVHINHRYLTRDDIISCQIETIHAGIEVVERNIPAPSVPPPAPTFMAVNITKLISSFPSTKAGPAESEQLDDKLRCNEKLVENEQCKEGNISGMIRTRSVLPLSTLAQACIDKSKSSSSTNVSQKIPHLQSQVSLECKETLDHDLFAPTKSEITEGSNQILLEQKSTAGPCFTGNEKPHTEEEVSTNKQATANVSSLNDDKLINNASPKPSEERKIKGCDKSFAKVESNGRVKSDDDLQQETIKSNSLPSEISLTPKHDELERSKSVQETHSKENKSEDVILNTKIGEDTILSMENGEKRILNIKNGENKVCSEVDKKVSHETFDSQEEKQRPNESTALAGNDEIDNQDISSSNIFKEDSKTKVLGLATEPNVILGSKQKGDDFYKPSSLISQGHSDVQAEDCKDETDSSVVSRQDKVVGEGPTDSNSGDLHIPLGSGFANNEKVAIEKTGHSEPEISQESSEKAFSEAVCEDRCVTEAGDKSTQPYKSDTAVSKPSGNVSPNSNTVGGSSNSAPRLQQAADTAAPQSQTPKNSQAPVIFLTNIVFPMGTSVPLGQSLLSPPKLATTGVSPMGVTTPTVTSSTSPTANSLGKSLSPGTRFAGPRAPVPLVLISQVPAGVDPRNAASAFLKTSTAIKTLQNLQNSLTVAAMGNANPQLSTSNLPCFIGPLTHGANVAAVKGEVLSGDLKAPLSLTSVTGVTSLPKLTSTQAAASSTTEMVQTSSSSSTALCSLSSINTTAVAMQSMVLSPGNSNCASSSLSTSKPSSSHINVLQTPVPTPSASTTSPRFVPDAPVNQPQDLFRCHMCVLVFQTMQQLKHHIRHDPHRFKGGIKQYACQQCSMRFSNKNNLHRHNLMNHKEAEDFKFRCFTCGKGFSSETYLNMHARFHLGKSFPCKYGCKDLYFPNAATLVKHLRTEHAGLDLKEYKRLHKIRRPSRPRKKINQILGAASTCSTSVPVMPPGNQMLSSIIPGQQSGTGADGHALPHRPQQDVSYSLLQPGVGFQAKRGRPKGSKNTVKNGQPIVPNVPAAPNIPLKIEIPSSSPVVEQLEVPKQFVRRARFSCKLCPRKFSTHLRLMRHRRKKHRMDQSVQEYLHIMSRSNKGFKNETDENVYSPPASPGTFFSNVCKRGFENVTQYIDGGVESLESPIRKYIRITGFTSLSAPFAEASEPEAELEWTSFNFPPCFKYKHDTTVFYDAESKQSLNVFTSKSLFEKKMESVSEKERDSTPEAESSHHIKTETLEEDLQTLPPKPGENVDEDGSVNTSQKPEADSGVKNENSVACEAAVCDIGSRERGKQVIESLARHLSCPKLPGVESDVGKFPPSEEDEIMEGEGDIANSEINIKTECLDQDPHDMAEREADVETNAECQTMSKFGKKEQILISAVCESEQSLNTKSSEMLPYSSVSNSNKSPSLETPKLVQDDSGTDSGLSSLSSCTLDDIKPLLNGELESQGKEKFSIESLEKRDQYSDNNSTCLEAAASEVCSNKMPISVKPKAMSSKLPALSVKEKEEVMKRLSIQGINVDGSSGFADRKHCIPASIFNSNLNALDLSVPGGQLSSGRLAQVVKSIKFRQESVSRQGTKYMRHRTTSLPSFSEGMLSLHTADLSKHHEHRRLSLWAGHLPQKAADVSGQETYHYCPVVNIIKKQQVLQEVNSYEKTKATRDKTAGENHLFRKKLAYAESIGLVSRAEFEMSPASKQREIHSIKPPEVWSNYENIWFGKRGPIVVVCSICHRHFSCWDLCLRHQLKKHPHIEPNSLQMEKGNYVDDMYYYYPMKFGFLAKTEPIPSNLPPPELFVCTRCGFPFRNLNRLHAHMVACDPSLDRRAAYRRPQSKNKLIPIMDRRLSQHSAELAPAAPKLGRPFKRPALVPYSGVSISGSAEKSPAGQPSLPDSPKVPDRNPSSSSYRKSLGLTSSFSFFNNKRRKNYELLYNPQNHMRRRELYQVLDTHQCHGCNLKFKSMSMLERHVKKCSGKDRLQSQKPLLSGIMPDDAAVRKQHTCRYCNKRFTYIKGVDLHYKRICSVRKVKEEEGKLSPEDLAHEEELRRIIEHLKWSKTLNKDSSDIIQGNVRVEEDGSLTRVVKRRGCPAGAKKRVKKRKVKNKRWTYMKNHRHANRSASHSAGGDQNGTQKMQKEHLITAKQDTANKSPQGYFGFQKKRSPPNDNTSPPAKHTRLSDVDSHRKPKKDDNPKELHSVGKRGRPRKYPADDPRSQRPRPKSATNETSPAEKAGQEQDVTESPDAATGDSTTNRPQPRKRGRPKKFDPSDMESSYKKKNKTGSAFVSQDVQATRGNKQSGFEEVATKLTSLQNLSTAVSTRQQRAKMSTAIVRDDYVYEAPGVKRRPAPSRAKGRAGPSQCAQDQLKPKEDTPLPDQNLMEKMKELKKAAQIESDRWKQKLTNRQEQRRAKLKTMQKAEGSIAIGQPVAAEEDKTLRSSLSSMSSTSSSELFKHLTEDIPLSSKSTPPSSASKSPKQIIAKPVTSSPSVTDRKSVKIKSVAMGNTASIKSSSVSVLVSDKPANLASVKTVTSTNQETASNCDKGVFHLVESGILTSKSKGNTDSKGGFKVESACDQLTKSLSVEKMLSTSVSLESKPKNVDSDSPGKSLKVSASSLPKCSVKVVTLSPNRTNLLMYEESSKNKSPPEKQMVTSYLPLKSMGEKPTTVTSILGKHEDVTKTTASTCTKWDFQKIDGDLQAQQRLRTQDISHTFPLNSNVEEKTAEVKSVTSQSSSKKWEQLKVVSVADVTKAIDIKVPGNESSTNTEGVAGLCHRTVEVTIPQTPAEKDSVTITKNKTVLVHVGKAFQIMSSTKQGTIRPSNVQPQSSSPKISSSLAASTVPKLPGLDSGNVPITSVTNKPGPQTDPAISSTLVDGPGQVSKKSPTAASYKIIKCLPSLKVSPAAPITVLASHQAVSVSMHNFPTTQRSIPTTQVNVLAPQKTSASGPITLLSADSIAPLQASKLGAPHRQIKPAMSTLSTHLQIKGGVVVQKPKVAQPTSPKQDSILPSHTNPGEVSTSKVLTTKVITSSYAQPSLTSSAPTILIPPASSQLALTGTKVVSPPAPGRIVSQSVPAVPAAATKKLRGSAPHKLILQPESQKLKFSAVVRSDQPHAGFPNVIGSLQPRGSAAGAQTIRLVSPVACAPTVKIVPPTHHSHVIRTLESPRIASCGKVEKSHKVMIPAPGISQTQQRLVGTNPIPIQHVQQQHSNQPATSSVLDCTSSLQVGSIVHPPAALKAAHSERVAPQPMAMEAAAAAAVVSQEPIDIASVTQESEPVFLQPQANPIMITLEDGSTAMLDPESLAQLLSPVDESSPLTTVDQTSSTATLDPGSIMVNMADIQPSQGIQTGEVLWEGFPDLSESIGDFS